MSPRQPRAAGAVVVTLATAALIGWMFDITTTKSVIAGWRVTVPATAATFAFLGIALICAAGHRNDTPNVLASRVFALFALALPLVTFVEYVLGVRTGVESWLGVRFDASSAVAGRMSPLTSICSMSLAVAVITAPLKDKWIPLSRVASGSTLLTAWLAILAVAFEPERLADTPVFPGMAIPTIVLTAAAAWGALGLTFERDSFFNATGTRPSRASLIMLVAFGVPVILGWVRELTHPHLSPQLLVSLLVTLLSTILATIVWRYTARMSALRRDRERAFAELEERVSERTRELASRNAELRLSEDRLREGDRRKDEFLATLAHELRNPLAPIRTGVAILRSPHATDSERADARAIIDRQVKHMSRLIDDLLDVSRISAGKLPMRKKPVLLDDVLNLAMSTVQPLIDQARHHFVVSLPREPITIDGDESRLAQVFANLLHNACKYTRPGGEIVLSVAMPSDHDVAINVRDNGIGIPADFLPRLFDKFSQVAPALDRSQGGLGLGLALVRGIVVAHGGRVEARSAGLGRGSEFIVHLPAVDAPAARSGNHSREPEGVSASSRRVLVVDDNEDSAESMAMLLRINGHIVEIANDGETATEVAERFQPDAILLDIGLPKMNGFEVCRWIRSRAWGGSVLIIAQTGWGQDQDRARTLDAGFDAHMTKPIDPDAVEEMLANFKTV